MTAAFYIAAGVAVIAVAMALTRANAIHALLYLVVSLLSIAVVFYLLRAPFVAALQVIIYAGAIVVLLLFVVMLLGEREEDLARERELVTSKAWLGPAGLGLLLAAELVYLGATATTGSAALGEGKPELVAYTLFGRYFLAVEVASMLLLAGLVAAYHLGAKEEGRR